MKALMILAAIIVVSISGPPGLAAAPPSSIQICITTTPVSGCVTKTINDADTATFISWCQSAYPGPNDVNGTPTVLSAAACLSAWAGGIFTGTVNNVTSWSKANAASTAATTVTPIKIQ